ncbi:glycine zipper 2TM domain-containing protein [Actinobacillus succinogenes]|uniref:17 kDa surface antigen n=1 Tax=Actinobacillus succinogenes (strain ATCC 55618 / DSM 22257 / CCUG 43843 / 130Z) TaxID=339671 RepID=A6VKG0_ACTSZ|nr:glycine zipper 2TM domain-containing protein [Actinobacillus succinogenes]ABR73457.1 17 kDa surface antigen [Actinobacillus succinogenes 130Z]PHI40081.1 glycine zipper 2TM domain-containing protein [Actinobacillus succinogenes]
MKKTWLKGLMIVAVATSVSACGLHGQQRDTATGALIGGVAGNLIGGNTVSTVAGAALGGVVGSQWNR